MVCNNLIVLNMIKKIKVLFPGLLILLVFACSKDENDLRLKDDFSTDHTCTDLAAIPPEFDS